MKQSMDPEQVAINTAISRQMTDQAVRANAPGWAQWIYGTSNRWVAPATPLLVAAEGGLLAVPTARGVGNGVAAPETNGAANDATGIIYRRTDLVGGKPYVGQAKSEARYLARQAEHARANPESDFEFEILGRAEPGVELDRMEEYFIRQGGGPTNLSNPEGGLANWRHQMSGPRYLEAGGDPW